MEEKEKGPVKLNLWAASLLAHREMEDGYELIHNAQLIKADSEELATQRALERAHERFPEPGYQYSVALTQIQWEAPEIGPISVTVEVRR